MSLFNNMLKDNESLFNDEIALDYDYLPKILPYREKEQRQFAECIKPLLQKRNARNLFVYGAPGIGKTAAARHVLRDLEKETDEVIPIYINCWKKNTTYRIAYEICEQMGLKFLQNKKSDELIRFAKDILNKKSAVFIFDEVDKLEDFDFLYSILEDIYRKSIILITNYRSWFAGLDERVKSRLTAETLEFKQYNADETKGIIKNRMSYAFHPNVWEDEAFNLAAEKTAELRDIRSGLYILKEAGLAAEERASRKITSAHVRLAISKLEDFSIKKSTDLEEEQRKILELIKENNNSKIGDLYKVYQEHGGIVSYKTFQRKIKKLEDGKFITVTRTEGGDEGNTSIIKFAGIKKLTDF
ncbi:AAA family ATPase [Candidatus Woesearchaeota archaeon]|nr:AAA family ATPase [Candidatus Woesearchaeota archaeon]